MGRTSKNGRATKAAETIYRAFKGLDRNRRADVALRILHDENVLADLYDHFLIQKALSEGGRRTSWRAYLARKRPAVR